MSAEIAAPSTIHGYQLRLPSFEGPLDVLLRLIERNQLAITDVSLAAVTEQFVAYLTTLDAAPPETIADFAAVAARLVLLKSCSLLPRPPEAADEAQVDDDLVQELAAYRAFKEAAQHLADRDTSGEGAFPRGETAIAAPLPMMPPRLVPIQPTALAGAIRRRLAATHRPHDVKALRPVISLREMIEGVLDALTPGRLLRFGNLVGPARDRHEVLTAFLAILVLVRRRLIEADQAELFGEITLRQLVAPAVAATAPAADD